MKEFKLRPYQKEFLDNYKADQTVEIVRRRGRSTYIGIDMGKKGGDKTAITQLRNKKFSTIIIDEVGTWPPYKWYWNPIKWFKFNRLMKSLKFRGDTFTLHDNLKGENPFYKGSK